MHKTILLAVLTALIKVTSADPAISHIPLINNAPQEMLHSMRCGKDFSNKSCGPLQCCSDAGYCGISAEYCAVPLNCQEKYGWCDSFRTPKGADVTQGKRKYNKKISDIIEHCTEPKKLALSFDDGPSEYTASVLDVLKAHNARATFFLGGDLNGRGSIDEHWATTVRRMIDEGHQIGSHTWSHPDLDVLESAQRKTQMHKNERAIINVIGKMPTFMRAPMVRCGEACRKDMRDLSYHVVGWEVDSGDWRDPTRPAEYQLDYLTKMMDAKNAGDGNMFIIQHDIHDQAASVVDGLLTRMEQTKADWKAVPLVECIGHSLDDAFAFPMYLEYNGVAPDGCLVSGPGFCLQPRKFTTKTGCNDALKDVTYMHSLCKEQDMPGLMTPAKAHCHQAKELSEDLEKFCGDCGKKGKPACDFNLFKTKNL